MGTKRLFMALCCGLCVMMSLAQNVKRPETYNYQRGLEAIQEDKPEEALEYLNKEIKDDPKNGYAYSWIALLRGQNGEFGQSLNAAEMAIKYLPKKDVEYVIFAYTTRAGIYLNLEDTVKAMNDYTTAIRISPDESSLYEKRAQIYYEQEKYNLADADYRKIVELKPGNVMGYMGLGRDANAQEKWEDAIKQFDYVIKLESEYSSGYSFRAESYIGLKKYHEATDDIIKALSIDSDDKAYYLMQEIVNDAFDIMKAKLKIQCTKSPNEAVWPYYLGVIHVRKKKFNEAINYFKQANSKDADPAFDVRIADCYSEMGDFENALSNIEHALLTDSTNVANIWRKANYLYNMGKADGAIQEMGKLLEINPEASVGYRRRGWFEEYSGKVEDAIEDYTMAITLSPDDAYAFFCRGHAKFNQGKKEEARSDFEKAIELDTDTTALSCAPFAYYYIGDKQKAIEYQNIAIRNSEDGDNYNSACLYSLMNEKDQALMYLRKALENGYRDFAHMELDTDLSNICSLDAYKALIDEYKEKFRKEISGDEPVAIGSNHEKSSVEIPFIKENGVCKVKCKINDLPLHFVFDTGASDVTISMVEANFMMKNGYLSSKDVVGSQRYMDANGDVSVGTVINLKNVNFGDLELNNVRASVVRNQKAPLLLGQSVLSRLGKVEIDNAKSVLRITK